MFIGIDNGLNGGIAVLDESGGIVATYTMPRATGPRGKGAAANIVDARVFSSIIGTYPAALFIALERPAGSQDVNAVQSMADSFATCRTVIECRRPGTLWPLTAWDWQRTFWPAPPRAKKGQPKPPKFDTKAAAMKAARELWPARDFLATSRSKVAHDGMVDACLIAEHLRRAVLNIPPATETQAAMPL